MQRTSALAVTCACVLVLLLGGTAGARAACRPGSSHRTACPLTHAVTGQVAADDSDLYYRFWARRGTQLRITVANATSPACALGVSPLGCDLVCARLITGTLASGCGSQASGIDRPASFQVIEHRTGVEYLTVNTASVVGVPQIPYRVSLLANPAVRWPAPCVVPRLAADTFAAVARTRLARSGCRAGDVSRVHSSVPDGDVIRLTARAGTIRRRGTRIGIVVSAGR